MLQKQQKHEDSDIKVAGKKRNAPSAEQLLRSIPLREHILVLRRGSQHPARRVRVASDVVVAQHGLEADSPLHGPIRGVGHAVASPHCLHRQGGELVEQLHLEGISEGREGEQNEKPTLQQRRPQRKSEGTQGRRHGAQQS